MKKIYLSVLLFVVNLNAQTVTTFAGAGFEGSNDGTGIAARFINPSGVAVDASGNIYVADTGNHLIRKITAVGVVSTFAGSRLQGSADGTGTAASFRYPSGVAVDASGNIFVADSSNHLIRKITAAGVVSTFAGSGAEGSADGTGTAASFRYPYGVAVDASGNIFVADKNNHLIRKITAAGVVSTFAGSGAEGSDDSTGTAASFKYPNGVAVDASGNIFVADLGNHKIRKIIAAGVVTTFAGSGAAGRADGTGTDASFRYPNGVAVDASGNIFVADSNNHLIRKITAVGVVSTSAGSSFQGNDDGTGTAASFRYPHGVAVDALGDIFVADSNNHMIRKITPALTTTVYEFKNLNSYPNPAQNEFYINIEEKAFAEMYTLLGNKVDAKNLTNGINTLDLSNLQTGVYIVKISNEKGYQNIKLVRD